MLFCVLQVLMFVMRSQIRLPSDDSSMHIMECLYKYTVKQCTTTMSAKPSCRTLRSFWDFAGIWTTSVLSESLRGLPDLALTSIVLFIETELWKPFTDKLPNYIFNTIGHRWILVRGLPTLGPCIHIHWYSYSKHKYTFSYICQSWSRTSAVLL